MSTDYEVVCDHCKKTHHLGQRMGGRYSFGYGTGDIEGAAKAMQFIADHSEHGGQPLRIFETGLEPDGYESVED